MSPYLEEERSVGDQVDESELVKEILPPEPLVDDSNIIPANMVEEAVDQPVAGLSTPVKPRRESDIDSETKLEVSLERSPKERSKSVHKPVESDPIQTDNEELKVEIDRKEGSVPGKSLYPSLPILNLIHYRGGSPNSRLWR